MTMTKKINDNTYLLEAELDGFNVRSAVVKGRNWNVVWDTLSTPEEMEQAVELVSDRDTVIVYSHADWDHVLGTSALTGFYKVIMAHHFCRDRFISELPDDIESLRKENHEKFKNITLLQPDITFSQQTEIDLGGLSMDLYHIPGHTNDSIVAYIPEEGLLLGGDAIENPFPTINDGKAVEEWITGLEKLAALKGLRTVIPSHGEPGGVELIHENILYLKNVIQGYDTEDDSTLNDFYRKVHKNNLKACGY